MDIKELLAEQFKETYWMQWIVLLLGVSEVLLARANKIALYPMGIAASIISIYLLMQAGLYGECFLNFYYTIMSFYGWWYWMKKKILSPVKITYTTKKEWIWVTSFVVVGYLMLFPFLKYFTQSTVPHWDALVTSTAWAGTWLLAKRKIDNWILLNISNAVAIPLLFLKGLPLYALLTVFLFIVAVQGYFSWRKKMRHENEIFCLRPFS